MVAERVSSRALAVRGTAALLIIAVLLFLFSTGLFIRIPLAYGVFLGDLVVLTLVMLFILRAEQLIAPLSSVISIALAANANIVGAFVQSFLRMLEIAVAYYSLRRLPLLLLSPLVGSDNAGVLYDAAFLVAACLVIYSFVKAIAR
ncbi:MAG: hypothetical protein QW498_03770 [Thermofilum sp.]